MAFEFVLKRQAVFGCAEIVRRNFRRQELCEQRHTREEVWGEDEEQWVHLTEEDKGCVKGTVER